MRKKRAKSDKCALSGAKMSVHHIFAPFLAVCGPFRLMLGHMAYFWATLDVVGEWAFWREKKCAKVRKIVHKLRFCGFLGRLWAV